MNNFKMQDYQSELEKMKERKLKRKQELEEIKKRQQELEAVKNTKPLYMKIEERYKNEIESLENQIKKSEKEKNSKLYSPIRTVDLMEHAKWYDEVKRQGHVQRTEKGLGKIRSASYGLSTAWTARVLDEDKRLKSELNRASQERLNMIERKTKYAELVKEIFLPTIDRLKRQELQGNSSPKRETAKYLQKSPRREEMKDFHSDSEGKNKLPLGKPKKFKENPMLPKPPQKKEAKVVDFLEERRKVRQEAEAEPEEPAADWEKDLDKDLPAEEKARMLKKKAKRLERQARKQELLLAGANPSNAKTLQQSASLNELLLNSVKAKLALLDNKNN